MYAQVVVSGKVSDAAGPLPAAAVQVKGTTLGVATDLDGNYQITVPNAEAVLVFSSFGYVTQEVAIGQRRVVNVTLQEDNLLIDESVVVAYGTAKKKDLTGSITAVDGGKLAVQSQSTVSRALEGAVPGLQMSAVDGQPGVDAGIRLRGIGSSSQNKSNALVVIDGVPQEASTSSNTNPLSSINPADIASITVLKDAASAALYGSRGANGVILVNTKNGHKGKTQITFEGRWGVNTVNNNSLIRKVGDSNPGDYYEMMWEAIRNTAAKEGESNPELIASQHLFDFAGYSGSGADRKITLQKNALNNILTYNVPGMTISPSNEGGTLFGAFSGANSSATLGGNYLIGTDGKLNPNAELLYKSASYADDLISARFRQEYKVTASGGADKMDYHFSLGYLSDPSYVQWSKFDRITTRAKVNAQITDWLKAGANFSYGHRNTVSQATRWGRNPGSATQNIFYWINQTNPLKSLYAHDLNGNIMTDADGNKIVHKGNSLNNTSTMTQSPIGPTWSMSYNLVDLMATSEDSVKSDDLSAKGYLEAKFLKHFKFTTNISYDMNFQTRTRFYNGETAGPFTGMTTSVGYSPCLFQLDRSYKYLDAQQLLNYDQDFGRHHVDAMLGHEYYQMDYNYKQLAAGYGLVDDTQQWGNYTAWSGYSTFGGTGAGKDKYALESYLAQASYVYDNKYYLTGSYRRDGSSKFRYVENRWGNFWSIGGGWKVSGEEFMAGTQDWLDFLKVRASYGLLGNEQGIGYYSGYQTWSWSGSNYGSSKTPAPTKWSLSQGGWVNANLTWENIYTTDAGFDATLFGGKLGLTFDWYNRQTTNSVWAAPVSYAAAGQTSLSLNSAGLRNRGFEIEVSYNVFKNRNWDFTVTANGTHYNTILTSVPEGTGKANFFGLYEDDEDPNGLTAEEKDPKEWFTGSDDAWSATGAGSSSGGEQLRTVGGSYYNLYMYKYGGVVGNSQVQEIFKGGQKVNVSDYLGNPTYFHRVTEAELKAGKYAGHQIGDEVRVIDYAQASKFAMGNAIPDWIGGLTFDLKYKNVDLSVQLAYQIGGKFYSVEYGNGLYLGSSRLSSGGALSEEMYGNTWSVDNPEAKFPKVYYESGYIDGSTIGSWAYTDMALFDASYISVKNITLGYTLPQNLTKKLGIGALRLFATADNAFMISGHSGVDPRMSLTGGMGVGAYAYPYLSSYNFGVNLTL